MSVEHRAIMLSRADRNRLLGAGKYLERKNFIEAETIQGIVERWDAAAGFTVVHSSAIESRPDSDARAA